MKTHIPYLLIIAVFGYFAFVRQKPAPSPSPSGEEQVAEAPQAEAPAKVQATGDEPASESPVPAGDDLWSDLDALSGVDDEAEPEVEAEKAAPANPFAMFQKMADNPEFKQAMKEQQALMAENAVEVEFRQLVDWFELKGEDRAAFKQLLLKREMAMHEMGMELLAGKDGESVNPFEIDPEKMKDMVAKRQSAQELIEQEIKAFLTPEAYEDYEQYQETRLARTQVEQVQTMFTNASMPLEPAQKDQLVELIHSIQTSPQQLEEQGIEQMKALQENPDGWKIMMQQQLDRQAKQSDEIVAASAEILSQGQVEELRNHFERQLRQQEVGMKMAQQFMPGLLEQGEDGEAPNVGVSIEVVPE